MIYVRVTITRIIFLLDTHNWILAVIVDIIRISIEYSK